MINRNQSSNEEQSSQNQNQSSNQNQIPNANEASIQNQYPDQSHSSNQNQSLNRNESLEDVFKDGLNQNGLANIVKTPNTKHEASSTISTSTPVEKIKIVPKFKPVFAARKRVEIPRSLVILRFYI